MTIGAGGFGANLDAIERFAGRMRHHIDDLRAQMDNFARADVSRLKLGGSAEAKRQALHHESVWAEYHEQLTRLCDVYERAWELTQHLLRRYRVAEEIVDEAEAEVQRQLDAATRSLPDVRP
jgi:hypothetical protein